MDSNNKESWISNIKEIFSFLNLDYLYQHSNKYPIEHIITKVKYALKNKFDNLWLKAMSDDYKTKSGVGSKLRTYRTFKNIFKMEQYLNYGTEKTRRLLTKFRVSAHNLKIEKGRYCNLEVENRKCDLCKNNIEDEIHFFIVCPKLDTHRKPYFQLINKYNKNFNSLSNCSKFIWLLSNEDKYIINILFKMLEKLSRIREELLKE